MQGIAVANHIIEHLVK